MTYRHDGSLQAVQAASCRVQSRSHGAGSADAKVTVLDTNNSLLFGVVSQHGDGLYQEDVRFPLLALGPR